MEVIINLKQFLVAFAINILNNKRMDGIKRKRRCEIECKEHIFSVQTLKGTTSKYDIKLQFCPKYQREPLPPEHTYPEYNDDEKFYTSAFILGVDRRVLLKNEQQELMDHQKQIRDSLEKHNQLVFPRPNSKHSLCSVCKEHYKNYYLHIASEQHREKIALSQYNQHIKEICSPYQSLWEGAQQRADADAEIRALQEEKMRQQRAEMAAQGLPEEEEEEDDEDELLDVNRGGEPNGEDQDEDDQDQDANYPTKPIKKQSKSVFKDDDTIPFTAKTSKRAAPEGRTYTSEYLRKKFLFNPGTQERAHREREERRYQRERDKIKTQRDNPQRKKQFIKINEKVGDTFIIMKAAFAITQPQLTQQAQDPQEPEFVWKHTANRFFIKETFVDKPENATEKYDKQNKKYEIDNSNEKFPIRHNEDREGQGMRPYPYPYYYPPMPHYPILDYKHDKALNQKTASPDGHREYRQSQKSISDYKKNPPIYYPPPPYMLPHMFEPYPRSEKQYDYTNEKDKSKIEKPLNYQSIPYPWPYPPSYYMPLASDHPNQSNTKSGVNGGTNININIPMYIAPPHPSIQGAPYSMPSRYPPQHMLSPYMGYQYPYMPNGGNREDYLLPPASSGNQQSLHSPKSNHSPMVTQNPSSPHNYPSTTSQPYHGYQQYMHQYPHHYPYHDPMPLPTATVK